MRALRASSNAAFSATTVTGGRCFHRFALEPRNEPSQGRGGGITSLDGIGESFGPLGGTLEKVFEINPDNFAVNDIVSCRAYPYPDPDEGNVSLNDDDTYCCDGNCTSVLEGPVLAKRQRCDSKHRTSVYLTVTPQNANKSDTLTCRIEKAGFFDPDNEPLYTVELGWETSDGVKIHPLPDGLFSDELNRSSFRLKERSHPSTTRRVSTSS